METDKITADVSDALKGLNNLEKKIAKSYVRKSLRAGCKVSLSAAIADAPEQSGVTKRNIKLRSAGTRKGVIRMVVGIGKKWYTGPAFYAAFNLFGHRIGNRKLGDSRRLLPPNNWLGHAYESTKLQVVEVFRATITALIESGE